MADLPPGPYGEPIHPASEADLTLDGFVRYQTKVPFPEVAAFFESRFKDVKHVYSARGDEDGQPNFVLSSGVKYQDGTWAAIVVMPMPTRGKRPSKGTHVIVTRKG